MKDEIEEKVRKELLESENPLFFFDDDPDGLCSYLLLRKYLGKGKGVVAKGGATLDVNFLRKVNEFSPDKIFVLDKPIISQEFIDKASRRIIWIDHHPVVERKGIIYYNPRMENKNLCTSYLCYRLTMDNEDFRKNNLWIAALGIFADWGIPDFFDEIVDKYEDLFGDARKEEEVLYQSEFGKLIKIFSFLLKGKTSDVNKNINILLKIESPYEILKQETSKGKYIFKIVERIDKMYVELMEKALKAETKDNLFVFTYPSGKMSFTGELSNELLYKFPGKIILVGREKDSDIRFSMRSDKIIISKILEKALIGIEGYGGGHEKSVGGNIAKKDWMRFIENIKRLI